VALRRHASRDALVLSSGSLVGNTPSPARAAFTSPFLLLLDFSIWFPGAWLLFTRRERCALLFAREDAAVLRTTDRRAGTRGDVSGGTQDGPRGSALLGLPARKVFVHADV